MPDKPNRFTTPLKYAIAGFIGGGIWLMVAKLTGTGPEMNPLAILASVSAGGFAGGLFRQKLGRNKQAQGVNSAASKSNTILIRRLVFSSRCATSQFGKAIGSISGSTRRTCGSASPMRDATTPIPNP